MSDIGGQAVIEGVMMRSGNAWTVAVRNADNEIVLKKERSRELPKYLKLPILRGVIALVQALSIGIRALLFSAEASGLDEEKPSSLSLAITVVFSFVVGIGLFLFIPLYTTKVMGALLASINESSLVFNLVDGIIRVLIFLLYVVLISRNSDIRRVFQYHGAEHKTIHAFEARVDLTPSNIEKFSTIHPRCGTSFLIMVMLLSILVFSLIPKEWPFIYKFLSRIALMPLIAGLSYEFIKFSSKKMNNTFVRILAMPGMWLQKLTTGIPSHDQIEVAVRALKEVLEMDPKQTGKKEIKADVTG